MNLETIECVRVDLSDMSNEDRDSLFKLFQDENFYCLRGSSSGLGRFIGDFLPEDAEKVKKWYEERKST